MPRGPRTEITLPTMAGAWRASSATGTPAFSALQVGKGLTAGQTRFHRQSGAHSMGWVPLIQAAFPIAVAVAVAVARGRASTVGSSPVLTRLQATDPAASKHSATGRTAVDIFTIRPRGPGDIHSAYSIQYQDTHPCRQARSCQGQRFRQPFAWLIAARLAAPDVAPEARPLRSSGELHFTRRQRNGGSVTLEAPRRTVVSPWLVEIT
jgi:hypothetical protein